MYDRILVPTDGSDVAASAADAAITLADRFGADLHVIHALELGELPPGADGEVPDDAAEWRTATRSVVERAGERGVEATGAVIEESNPVHETILGYGDEHGVDCIVMGTHGRRGLDRAILGSVAERTIRGASVPVVTVKAETELDPAFDSVLVGTDGSDHALAAADHAIELTLATDGTLHVVHAVDPAVVLDLDAEGLVPHALEEVGDRAIEKVVDRAGEAGLSSVETAVRSGSSYREIVAHADEHDVDCIVLGTHGRSGLDRLLLGSVTERVVRLTDRPVIAVKLPDED